MACYAGTQSQAAVCVSDGERPPYPIVVDPLNEQPDAFDFDLIGRQLSRRQALVDGGQAEWMTDSLQLLNRHSVFVGLLVPLLVPLMHYGLRLGSKCRQMLYLVSDTYRILFGPWIRRLFCLPVDAEMQPAYVMYVYCCDLLNLSSPELEEFLDPVNRGQFLSLLTIINPFGFTFANKWSDEEILQKYQSFYAPPPEEAAEVTYSPSDSSDLEEVDAED